MCVSVLCLIDVASGPAGTSVGSVTTQISAIQLTKPGQPASMLSSSPYPSYGSPSPTEECQDGEAQLLGWETVDCYLKQLNMFPLFCFFLAENFTGFLYLQPGVSYAGGWN